MTETLRTLALAVAAIGALGATAAALAQGTPPAVRQKDRTFSEEQVTIRAGGAVRFINDDSVAHNVYVRDPSGANRPGMLQRPGDEGEVAFERPGDHDVRCAIHPRMRMIVRVQS